MHGTEQDNSMIIVIFVCCGCAFLIIIKKESMTANLELSINERVNGQMYSDVIASYVDINSVTAQRNIVPGSYKETVVQCTDQTLATLNSAGGQTLFTRLKLTPQVRNATLAQLAQIYFQYYIKANSLGLILKEYANADTKEALNETSDNLGTGGKSLKGAIHFKLFYDTGFSIASMVQLCLTADAKVSTENFNYQQALLTLNSLPDYVTEHSNSESTLKALVEDTTYAGVGSGLVTVDFDYTGTATQYGITISKDIGIEGLIDLDRGNPLFHNFPIITRNMGEMYIRLYMENFLRELKVVYLDKIKNPATFNGTVNIDLQGKKLVATKTWGTETTTTEAVLSGNGTDNQFNGVGSVTVNSAGAPTFLPYQRLPADKADFIYINGKMYKVKLVNMKENGIGNAWSATVSFKQNNPIFSFTDEVQWTRFEIRKVEFDIEDYEDIKASQAKAGVYKFPVHLFRSKNFDQTNAASSSANALQTTLNAPNIDRMFITQPFTRDYYTFLPTINATDMNPQLHNNPVLPRTEDTLNSRTVERIGSVFVDTDKYSIPRDLFNSLYIPTYNKKLWLKDGDTYGGKGALEKVQRGISPGLAEPSFIPNKFAYGLELNCGGCFRRGFNSVIDGGYSPTVPINMQQSVQTANDAYYDDGTTFDTVNTGASIVNNISDFNSCVSYGSFKDSGAVASVHCLCDYIFSIHFDQFGNMTDFGVSEYNGQGQ